LWHQEQDYFSADSAKRCQTARVSCDAGGNFCGDKLICETKALDRTKDREVLAKARAAVAWCEQASEFEMSNGGKPWRYLLIPHDRVGDNATVRGLVEVHGISSEI